MDFTSTQGGDSKYREAWSKICEISRREFQKVYVRLGVQLEEKVLFTGLKLDIIS